MADRKWIILSLLMEHLSVRRWLEKGTHEWHMNRAMIRTLIGNLRLLRKGLRANLTVKDFISWDVPFPPKDV